MVSLAGRHDVGNPPSGHTGRPYTISLAPNTIPAELKDRDQWVCWRWARRDRKWTKVPVNALTGGNARADRPGTWSSFASARDRLERIGDVDGIGFVFSASDPYCGIDLDKARNPETGELTPDVRAIVDRFASYAESSISGTGIHIIVKGSLPAGGRKKGRIEAYDRGRYFVMSGHVIAGAGKILDRGTELAGWHAETFAAPMPVPSYPAFQVDHRPLEIEDRSLLSRCLNSLTFQRLHAGDTGAYPSQSEADLAYLDVIVRNGGSPDQADSLMRSWRCFRAEKWDGRHYGDGRTYGEGTIAKAFNGFVQPRERQRSVVQGIPAPAATLVISPDDTTPSIVQELQTRLVIEQERADRAERRVIELETELQEVRAENSMLVSVAVNPSLKAEAPTIIRTAVAVLEAKRRGDIDSNQFVRISTSEVGDDWLDRQDNIDRPIRSRSSVNRHLKKAAEYGLIEREVRSVMAPRVIRDQDRRPVIDPETNKPRTYVAPTDQTWIKMTGDSIADLLRPFALFRAPDELPGESPKSKHGGDRRSERARAEQINRRTPCPDCNSTERIVWCKGCGADITELAESEELQAAAEIAAFQDAPLNKRGSTRNHLETDPIDHAQVDLAYAAWDRRDRPKRSSDISMGAPSAGHAPYGVSQGI